MAFTRPVYKNFSGGFKVWGGAQPGIYRLDAGPRVTMQVRKNIRMHLDYRQKIAGNAQPGSGRQSRSLRISSRSAAPSRCLRLGLDPPMDIYLPIAGQSVNALLIVLLGFLVGLLWGCSASAAAS